MTEFDQQKFAGWWRVSYASSFAMLELLYSAF